MHSILSDELIQQRCVAPVEIFDEAGYKARLRQGIAVPAFEPAAQAAYQRLRDEYTRATTQDERDAFEPMISPFSPALIRAVESNVYPGVFRDGEMVFSDPSVAQRKIVSRGLTSYGYDVALARDDVKIFTNINSTIIDPKRFDAEKCLVDARVLTDDDGALYVVLPPNSYLLGRTIEYFKMPRDVIAVCLGKSTYARTAIAVNVTPIEPGFHGNVVIEVANLNPLPAKIYLEEGISQFLFFQGPPCKVSYADRGGKYQGQTGTTMARV